MEILRNLIKQIVLMLSILIKRNSGTEGRMKKEELEWVSRGFF